MAQVRKRRREARPTYLWWWLKWAFVLFWPLLIPGIGPVIEAVWLAVFAGIGIAAWTGRRRARRNSSAT